MMIKELDNGTRMTQIERICTDDYFIHSSMGAGNS